MQGINTIRQKRKWDQSRRRSQPGKRSDTASAEEQPATDQSEPAPPAEKQPATDQSEPAPPAEKQPATDQSEPAPAAEKQPATDQRDPAPPAKEHLAADEVAEVAWEEHTEAKIT